MPCLAFCVYDGKWYRAQVLRVLSDGIEICYVDFGNTRKMPNIYLHRMELSFAEPPFFATQVRSESEDGCRAQRAEYRSVFLKNLKLILRQENSEKPKVT